MKIGLTFFSVTLTALILINSTRASLTYAYYNIDPIGFIEALCENQDKPELQCNGKCHLKKVAQSQDKKENTPESIVDFKELILYPSPMTTFVLARNIYIKKEFFSSYFNLYSFNTSNDCFHPPRL
jgi:hypothetical protein